MTIYRKIYEEHYGQIPVDNDGRTYEIHHIDGNRKNNDPSNLKAVSIQEHYAIHYSQSDWAACLRIAKRMSLSKEEISNLARLNANRRVENKTHPFLGSNLQKRLVEEGRHRFIDSEYQRFTSNKRVSEGSHHWLTDKHKNDTSSRSKSLLDQGLHNFQKKYPCECGCGKSYNKGNLTQHLKALTNV